MTSAVLPWRTLRITTTLGNLLGAVLTFFYFRLIDPEVAQASGSVSIREIAISLALFAVLVAIAYPVGRRWLAPLVAQAQSGQPSKDPVIRRRALLVPYVFACL